ARSGGSDLRRTLRRALRTGGEPIELAWRDRRRRRRRLVLLLDVSGSMAAYSRALVVFAHAALRADRRFEAFSFGTRLTRLTRALATTSADEALRRAARETEDWDGGTRIGASLKEFLDHYGHPGMARGSVVVICSDGLEVGDPELLAAQMERLHRLAHRVIWLNPLKENPDYAPLARGMKAALPRVDVFASGHSLASLEEIAATLEQWD
ncbi:MAG: VWA domain-containing protein, partial [Thermoleophilia bacterium]|nr:VWA domain-containing protein [Thermoleophilia bacterium]